MLGNSIWSFGHLEYINPSIIAEMGHCSRIRKNVTDREWRIENRQIIENRQTEKQITEATLIPDGLFG